MKTKDEVLARLYDAYRASGLSYAALEKKTGISHSTIQRYVTGRTKKIPIKDIATISQALGCDPRDILGWNNETEENNAAPVTDEARILASGIDKMPETDRQKALDMMKLMFSEYADYFNQSDRKE